MEKEEGRSCGSRVLEIFFLILAIYTLYYDSVCIEPQKFTYIVIFCLLDMTEAF